MFNKIKNKFSNNGQRRSRAVSETSTLDNIPTINYPAPDKSTSSTPTGYRSRYASMSSIPDRDLPSITQSRSISRGRSLSTGSAYAPAASQTAAKSHGRRKRDIFWRSGMWDGDGPHAAPRGSVVRAKSSSRPNIHPEVAKERMEQENWRP